MRSADRAHGLRVEELAGDFKSGLTELLARRPIRAVLIGTRRQAARRSERPTNTATGGLTPGDGRRGDPNAADQNVFCPSSDGWPPFMRVNPILEWSYTDVWAFLGATRVAYCSLYDRGYTSIGSIATTAPNRHAPRPAAVQAWQAAVLRRRRPQLAAQG